MENCPFCKIVRSEISSYVVYESENTLAFLDINPHAKGHTVVIPRFHAQTIFDLSDEHSRDLMDTIKKTMEKVRTVLKPAGFNVGWNSGKAGGQAVPHLHVHILPRYLGDRGGSMHSIVKNPGIQPVQQIAALFRNGSKS